MSCAADRFTTEPANGYKLLIMREDTSRPVT
jgi:hypothetical protein